MKQSLSKWLSEYLNSIGQSSYTPRASEFTTLSKGLAPYKEFLKSCYSPNNKGRTQTLARLEFNYSALDRDTWNKELTAIAQLDAKGIDDFIGLEDNYTHTIKYRTTHGKRCLRIDNFREREFEVLTEGDGFAQAKALSDKNSFNSNFELNTTVEPKTNSNHRFVLSSAAYNSPLYLDISRTNKHKNLLIVGSEGCGKSTLLAVIARQALQDNVPIVSLVSEEPNGYSRLGEALKSIDNTTCCNAMRSSFNPFEALKLSSFSKSFVERFGSSQSLKMHSINFYQRLIEQWLIALIFEQESEKTRERLLLIRCAVDSFFCDPMYQEYYSHGRGITPTLIDFIPFCSPQRLSRYDYNCRSLGLDDSADQFVVSRLNSWICHQITTSSIPEVTDNLVISVPKQFNCRREKVLAFTMCLAAFRRVIEQNLKQLRPLFAIDVCSTNFQYQELNTLISMMFADSWHFGTKTVVCDHKPTLLQNEYARENITTSLVGHIEPSSIDVEYKFLLQDKDLFRQNFTDSFRVNDQYSSWVLSGKDYRFTNFSDHTFQYHLA